MVGAVGVRWRLQSVHDLRGKRELPASRFRTNSGQALRMAALKDFGIVMQAEVLLAQDIAAGRLVPILCDHLPPPRPMNLVYPRDRLATPKLTTFIDFMVERFGPAASPLLRTAGSSA
jgi:DNA-binding transcriptional LysR family regulator